AGAGVASRSRPAPGAARRELPTPMPVPAPPPRPVAPSLPPASDPSDSDGSAENAAEAPRVPAAALAQAKAGSAQAASPPTIAGVRALLQRGDSDGALAALYRLRAQRPPAERASLLARLIGHVYFDRQWWTDALREYRFALTLDRAAAHKDATVIHN